MTDANFKNLLSNKQATASALLIGLIDKFGVECFDWDPLTLRSEIKDNWGVELSLENSDKVWAMITVLTSNLFYSSLEVFINTCNAFSDSGADFHNYDPATIQEICWALTEVQLMDPPDTQDSTYQFKTEILSYMYEELRQEGFTKVPKLLQPYFGQDLDDSTKVDEVFAGDEIMAKSYWDGQTEKKLQIDNFIKTRLQQLITEVTSLTLQHGNPEAIQQLKARAGTTLARQSQQTSSEVGQMNSRPSF